MIVQLKKAQRMHANGQFIQATDILTSLMEEYPDDVTVKKLLAVNLVNRDKYTEAEPVISSVLKLEPENTDLARLLAVCFSKQGKFSEESKILSETPITSLGGFMDIAINRENLHLYEEAAEAYQKIIDIEPAHPGANLNLSKLESLFGLYDRAWPRYEYRRLMPEMAKKGAEFFPWWNGESLKGKAVLVLQEQGIGDSLFFCHLLHYLSKDARKIYFLCDERLHELVTYNFPKVECISSNRLTSLQNVDCQLFIGSLNSCYMNSSDDVPKVYLRPPPPSIEKLQNKVDIDDSKLKIGISWFHGKRNADDHYSLDLRSIVENLCHLDCRLFNLQYGHYSTEVSQVNREFQCNMDTIESFTAADSFADFSALIDSLDVVITVSNATFILSAMLGKKTYLLIPHHTYHFPTYSGISWFHNAVECVKEPEENWTIQIQKIIQELSTNK